MRNYSGAKRKTTILLYSGHLAERRSSTHRALRWTLRHLSAEEDGMKEIMNSFISHLLFSGFSLTKYL